MMEMNKREDVLKELGKLAQLLNISIDYIVDNENKREYLVCDNQKICTNATSISGIRQEFFGYVFLREWKHRSLGWFDKQSRNYIKQYWYDEKFNQPYLQND